MAGQIPKSHPSIQVEQLTENVLYWQPSCVNLQDDIKHTQKQQGNSQYYLLLFGCYFLLKVFPDDIIQINYWSKGAPSLADSSNNLKLFVTSLSILLLLPFMGKHRMSSCHRYSCISSSKAISCIYLFCSHFSYCYTFPHLCNSTIVIEEGTLLCGHISFNLSFISPPHIYLPVFPHVTC